jgi:type VI secretion system secreted protein VgrG
MASQPSIGLSLTNAPLGTVTVASCTLREGLSIPTRATLLVRADDPIDEASPLGTAATLLATEDGKVLRTWHLVVREIQYEFTRSDRHHYYTIDLAHPFALLAHRSDVRIFQKMTTKEIVNDVLQRSGTGVVAQWHSISHALPQRVYCVQYRETDFDFVSRLLEHDGIFYVCNDGDGGDEFGLAGDKGYFKPIDGPAEIPLAEGQFSQGVYEFEVEHTWTTDQYVGRDWNFETPRVVLEATAGMTDKPAGQVYEFPGSFSKANEADDIAKVRLEEIASRITVASGRSDQIEFRPSRTFHLGQCGHEVLNGDWLIREVRHSFSIVPSAESPQKREDAPPTYQNTFVCSPLKQPYRPPRRTPRPIASGSDCVVVTGPAGQEIHTDPWARMTGHFYWDRVGKADQTSSTWMRVAQLPIGGSMALARTKWEMIARYLYGDPDRPIAVARVDNGVHVSPYAYPTAKTAMSLKTLTSPGAGKHNEFSMEDGSGGMKVAVTASKDYFEQVNNDKTQKIAVDHKLEVGVDCSTAIGASQKIDIGAMLTKKVSSDAGMHVGSDRTKTVGAAEMVTVSGNETATVGSSDTETVGACRMTTATMGISRTVKGTHSLTVGGAMISASALGCSVAVAGAKTETVGGAKLVLSGSSVGENVIGALALTVGGVMLSSAGGKAGGTAKGASSVEVGGVAMLNGGSKIQIKAKSVKITVGGVANLLGGGGILNMTPGSASFVGLVTLNASGGVSLSGAPNLAG